MRRYIWKREHWLDKRPPAYKCANAEQGCTELVDKPLNVCWNCTMAELNAKKASKPTEVSVIDG